MRQTLTGFAPALGALLVACGDAPGDVVTLRGPDAGAPVMRVVEAGARPLASGTGGVPVVDGSSSGCNMAGGNCVDCSTSHDCPEERAFCHPRRRVCVQCLSEVDCDGSRICSASGVCVRTCSTAADCNSDRGGICDFAAHVCIECRTNSDCSDGDHPMCIDGSCVAP